MRGKAKGQATWEFPLICLAFSGSSHRGKIRTFLTFTILTGALCTARGASHVAYRFDDGKQSECFDPPETLVPACTLYRNPIVIALILLP